MVTKGTSANWLHTFVAREFVGADAHWLTLAVSCLTRAVHHSQISSFENHAKSGDLANVAANGCVTSYRAAM